MITFIATVHILACVALIALVLVQDSKGGGVFSTQTSTNSVLGASNATSLAGTLTKWVCIVLTVTCIALAALSTKSGKSVVDSGTLPTQNAPVNAAAAVSSSATTTDTATASSTTK